ncbi:MAG: fibronectin type III domain-containing protein [Candidatus Zixiibacteriota bacterium]
MRKLIGITILLLLLTTSGFSGTYYLSKTGSDSRTGTSWDNAWATISKVNSSLRGGDTLYIGPGTWEDVQLVPPTGASHNDRTAIISGNGFDNTPTIGTAHIYGGKQATGWTNVTGNIYRCYFTQNPGLENIQTVYMAVQDTTFLHEELTYSSLGVGEFHYRNDSLYVWLNDQGEGYNPANYTIYASMKIPINAGWSNHSYTTLYGLDVRYGASKGILFGHDSYHSDSFFIEHCIVKFCGRTGSNNAACIAAMRIATSDTSRYGHYNKIVACTLSNIYGTAGDHRNGVTVYCEQYFTFDSNYVYGASAGIDNKGGGDYSTQRVGDCTRYNKFYQCQKAVVRDQVLLCDSVYGNFIYSDSSDGSGIWYDFHNTGTPLGGDIHVYNNTIVLTDGGAKSIVFGTEGSVPDVTDSIYCKYNVVFTGGSSSYGIMTNYYIEDSLHSDSNFFYPNVQFRPTTGTINFTTWQSQGWDEESEIFNPSIINYNNFARTDSLNIEMNAEYGGKRWTLYGAWQPGSTPDCDPPDTTALLLPENGATDLYLPYTFDWADVDSATTYQLQIDNNSTFASPEVDIYLASSAYEVSGLLEGTTYHWRVRAFNTCGGGGWSSSRNFTTHCDLLTAPDIAQPVDGLNNVTQPVHLSWNDITGAVTYQLQVDDDSLFGSSVLDYEQTESSYDISGLEDGATYYWRVRAYNQCGWGSWSITSSFTTFSFATQTFQIYDIEVLNITNTSAVIEWKTTEEAYAQVQYGTDATYGSATPFEDTIMIHSVTISSLEPETEYHFRIVGYNADDSLSISVDSTFITRSTVSGGSDGLEGDYLNVYNQTRPVLRVFNYSTSPDNLYYFELAGDSNFVSIEATSTAILQESSKTTSWEVPFELETDHVYYWRANVNNEIYSPIYAFTVVPKVFAMPNPYRPTSDQPLIFANVPVGASLVIKTVSGNEVIRRWTNHSGGDITWDGTNSAGNQVASHAYLWYIENSDTQGKIIVLR